MVNMTGYSLPIELISVVVAALVAAIGFLWHRLEKMDEIHCLERKEWMAEKTHIVEIVAGAQQDGSEALRQNTTALNELREALRIDEKLDKQYERMWGAVHGSGHSGGKPGSVQTTAD